LIINFAPRCGSCTRVRRSFAENSNRDKNTTNSVGLTAGATTESKPRAEVETKASVGERTEADSSERRVYKGSALNRLVGEWMGEWGEKFGELCKW
jgi:hypothetical protein